MAIYDRLVLDNSGRVMVPTNIDGGNYSDSSNKSAKVFGALAIVGACVLGIMYVMGMRSPIIRLVGVAIVLFVGQLILRYAVLNERYFMQVYLARKRLEDIEPYVFWNIPIIQDTPLGAVLVFSDGRMGMVLKAEMGTITGRPKDFRAHHYEAISDFYKELNLCGFSSVRIDLMEQAGRDPRMAELDNLTMAIPNRNLAKLMEMQVGHIKRITRESLYDSEYYMVYTSNKMPANKMAAMIAECATRLMGGAYAGYRALDRRECSELYRRMENVEFFDYGKATAAVYGEVGETTRAFEITAVEFANGDTVNIDSSKRNIISNLTSWLEQDDNLGSDVTVREALDGLNYKNKYKIEENERRAAREKAEREEKRMLADIKRNDVYVDLDEDVLVKNDIADTVANAMATQVRAKENTTGMAETQNSDIVLEDLDADY